ncbi:MAG: hypothetical protein KBB37_07595 [Bacteroidia bacterium]|nr:hypothetical protein [Bacteroidia bacterium]MBP7261134.1 hypothetical protein [Bacteroidia bacterium]MBP9180511.1 hypothetical protein [Bacteroidia bacterium]MBP9724620.1 hypothetical protein [Bacteroidia bacterium]
MHPIVRNILAVIAGAFIGSLVNGSLIMMSSFIIPPPNGADVTTEEGLKAAMHLFEPKHFIMPFLAHAIGTLIGAVIAVAIAANNKMKMAIIVGILFFMGGIANVLMLPAPMWFNILDLVVAYFPMAFLAGKIMIKK